MPKLNMLFNSVTTRRLRWARHVFLTRRKCRRHRLMAYSCVYAKRRLSTLKARQPHCVMAKVL